MFVSALLQNDNSKNNSQIYSNSLTPPYTAILLCREYSFLEAWSNSWKRNIKELGLRGLLERGFA